MKLEQADEKFGDWIKSHRGRRVYFIFERGRQAHMQTLLPSETRATFRVIYEQNNKFSVGYAEI